MMKIVFTMDNGHEFVLSSKVYGGNGPMTRTDAQVQLSMITEKLRYFAVDDGSVVMVEHITSAKITD